MLILEGIVEISSSEGMVKIFAKKPFKAEISTFSFIRFKF